MRMTTLYSTQIIKYMTKREQWESVKNQAPEVANFITALSKAFGKPSAVGVKLNSGEVILRSGVFEPEKPNLQIRQWRFE